MSRRLANIARRQELRLLRTLFRAAPGLATAWCGLVVVRGALPAVLAVGFGWLVGQIADEAALGGPLALVASGFTLGMVLHPLHQFVSMSLGARLTTHLYDRLMVACAAPAGIGHLERPDLAGDFAMARDFDQGMMGPPLDLSMDFITGGLVELLMGIAAAVLLFGFAWWAPIVAILGWGCTHWLLRESGVWKDRHTDEVRLAQRRADYSYRLAVDAAPAKELRYFGLAGWVIQRFIAARRHLYDLQYEATRLREKSVLLCLLIVAVANGLLLWRIGAGAVDGRLSVGESVVFMQAAIGAAAIAFGGLNWALDGACGPVVALERLEAAIGEDALTDGGAHDAIAAGDATGDAPELRFDRVAFAYPRTERPVLDDFSLVVPGGSSVAIVGHNGVGKTTLAKLLCRLYEPTSGLIRVDGRPLDELDAQSWRRQVTAVFQDFVRFERSLRFNVAPRGASDDEVRTALTAAGASHLADGDLDVVLSKAYPNGTDLSGGQWQRIALARALCSVQQGARVVLLDEPTAQLDVRGEAEIFERLLAATRQCTTVLISHRFSTVRLADRIAVVEHGSVVEYGSHDELIQLNGRYRTMFDLQAARFVEVDDRGEELVLDSL